MKVSFSPTSWTGIFTNIPFFLQFSCLRCIPWNPGFPSCTSPQVRCAPPLRTLSALSQGSQGSCSSIKKSQWRSESLCPSKAVNSVFAHHLPLFPLLNTPPSGAHHVSPSSKPTPARSVSFGPVKYGAARSTAPIARHL